MVRSDKDLVKRVSYVYQQLVLAQVGIKNLNLKNKNMEVDKKQTIIIDNEHSIEFGDSSWDNGVERTIRRRKDLNGKYDPISSSELPINGHVNISHLIIECLKNDLIFNPNLKLIYDEIVLSAKRQGIII